MLDDEDAAALKAAEVEAVVEQWGEGFRALASNPRLRFEGEEIAIVLWKPIKITGQDAAELKMREPTLNDLGQLDNLRGQMLQARRLVVACCAITDREAGAIGMRDMGLIALVAEAFTGAARSTGATL